MHIITMQKEEEPENLSSQENPQFCLSQFLHAARFVTDMLYLSGKGKYIYF